MCDCGFCRFCGENARDALLLIEAERKVIEAAQGLMREGHTLECYEYWEQQLAIRVRSLDALDAVKEE